MPLLKSLPLCMVHQLEEPPEVTGDDVMTSYFWMQTWCNKQGRGECFFEHAKSARWSFARRAEPPSTACCIVLQVLLPGGKGLGVLRMSSNTISSTADGTNTTGWEPLLYSITQPPGVFFHGFRGPNGQQKQDFILHCQPFQRVQHWRPASMLQGFIWTRKPISLHWAYDCVIKLFYRSPE